MNFLSRLGGIWLGLEEVQYTQYGLYHKQPEVGNRVQSRLGELILHKLIKSLFATVMCLQRQ